MEDGRDLLAVPISDAATVRRLLIEAAKARRDISYADLLDRMGHAFSRPKMRALCKTLGAVDDAAVAKGEPELAVLVVRQSDRLPGDGWWVSCAERLGYHGLWTGPDAVKFIRRQQKKAFDYWSGKRIMPRAGDSARGKSAQKRSRRRSAAG
ncbi:hypothetical protein [Dongia sedimenti]|uniref:Ribose-phosphate pyrophosphokinase n=1 Tax=Dongia sedimenti TaxID=3064282 RepID=A0ABU0YRK0_9PROT|nr:hypothetical protein [Rhodospirillaceae bacterium R-7]